MPEAATCLDISTRDKIPFHCLSGFQSISSAYKKGKGEGLIPLTELFALYNAGGWRMDGCALKVILHEVSKGNYKQGIEAWVNYY